MTSTRGAYAADGPHDDVERPGVPVGVVGQELGVGTGPLGFTPAMTDDHPGRGRRR